MFTKFISGWGNYKTIKSNIYRPSNIDQLKKIIKKNKKYTIRALGRSYGDSSIGKNIISLDKFKNFIKLDDKNGIISCSSSSTIQQILKTTVKKGWFLKVTPGSKFISVGGLIASDVHGKNHHIDGTFCNHLIKIEILLNNGKILEISKTKNQNLFKATCGGMGLTGIILSAKFRMHKIKSSYMIQNTIKTYSLKETIYYLDKFNHKKYVVGWIETANYNKLGRSIIYRADHYKKGELNFDIKKIFDLHKFFQLFSFLSTNFILKKMSSFYFNIHSNKKNKLIHINKFFYPLDFIGGWNYFYGKNGFIQFQILIKKKNAINNIKKILTYLVKNDQVSFLSTIKKLGKKNNNYLTFPENGYTLTMDIKNNSKMKNVFRNLEKFLIKIDSKVYLTKDSIMSKNYFYKTYTNLNMFKKNLNKYNKFSSLQSERLKIK
jgi:decaprenylphospho-beta-D-ribofuranose 2-oxidase